MISRGSGNRATTYEVFSMSAGNFVKYYVRNLNFDSASAEVGEKRIRMSNSAGT
jgi:hypothetical protein